MAEERALDLAIISDDGSSKMYYYDYQYCNYISNIVHLGFVGKTLLSLAKPDRPKYLISPKRKYTDSKKEWYYRFSLDEVSIILKASADKFDTFFLKTVNKEIPFQVIKVLHYLEEIRKDPCFRVYLMLLAKRIYAFSLSDLNLEFPVVKGSSVFIKVPTTVSSFKATDAGTSEFYDKKKAVLFNRLLMEHNISKKYGIIEVHDKIDYLIKQMNASTGEIHTLKSYREVLQYYLFDWKGEYFDYGPKIKIKYKKNKTTPIPEEYVDINITFRKLHKELS